METNIYTLEKSTGTHLLHGKGQIAATEITPSIIAISVLNGGAVKHPEHGPAYINGNFFIKYVQQELNPVTQALQNAYD